MNKKILTRIGIWAAVAIAIAGCMYDEDIAYAISVVAAGWFAWRADREET
jgi:hypothetical protein